MESFKDLGWLGAAFLVFLVIQFYVEEREKIGKSKKKLESWWKENTDEKNFQSRVKFFLMEYPFPRNERQQKEFRKNLNLIQFFLRKGFLRKDKISFDVYEELYYKIEAKKKEISF